MELASFGVHLLAISEWWLLTSCASYSSHKHLCDLATKQLWVLPSCRLQIEKTPLDVCCLVSGLLGSSFCLYVQCPYSGFPSQATQEAEKDWCRSYQWKGSDLLLDRAPSISCGTTFWPSEVFLQSSHHHLLQCTLENREHILIWLLPTPTPLSQTW